MTLFELLDRLESEHGIRIKEAQVRYAYQSGKMTRPVKDGSGRCDYSKVAHFDVLATIFKHKAKK